MPTVNLAEGASGATAEVLVSLGDTVVVRLPEPGGTGYQWVLRIAGPGLAETYSTLQVAEDGPVAPGAGAVRVIGLRAQAAGVCEVGFELRRAWEDPGLEPADRRVVRVEVSDPSSEAPE